MLRSRSCCTAFGHCDSFTDTMHAMPRRPKCDRPRRGSNRALTTGQVSKIITCQKCVTFVKKSLSENCVTRYLLSGNISSSTIRRTNLEGKIIFHYDNKYADGQWTWHMDIINATAVTSMRSFPWAGLSVSLEINRNAWIAVSADSLSLQFWSCVASIAPCLFTKESGNIKMKRLFPTSTRRRRTGWTV